MDLCTVRIFCRKQFPRRTRLYCIATPVPANLAGFVQNTNKGSAQEMNHYGSRYTSFAFASGGIAGRGGARGELSSGNLSRKLSSPMAESTQLDSSGIRGNLYDSPVRQVGVRKRSLPLRCKIAGQILEAAERRPGPVWID
ncbi:uncharacterized protein LOC131690138 [Topomyia yanbarensis]|uniref:uncharacterized protein LOC131690138 n=1 Tax=Topomyia yanbarensis TaxID=2498891 RepID=UPI00273BE930|nr:uncharacterized protein LOC131690138 [Topomyia yanbarensis]